MRDRSPWRWWVLLGVILVGGVLVWYWSADEDHHFPNQYDDAPVDVSLEEALSDHGLVLPDSAEGVRYTASQGLDGYPMSARFTMPCDRVPEFVSDNGYAELDSDEGFDPGTVLDAEDRGVPIGADTSYYMREGGGYGLESYALATADDADCTVFLTA
ncbi:hypothetical protein [Streptomyces sp. NPDC127098]|uniref:hypothetical protein n=1 Tax=Streptomyces sp. NPDC127098 TaxID=3347137 RepID=UPI00364E290B